MKKMETDSLLISSFKGNFDPETASRSNTNKENDMCHVLS